MGKVCSAVKEAAEMFEQTRHNQPTQKQATKLSSHYRALSSLASDLLEQRNAFDTFRARFLMRHALSITRDLLAIGRNASLALASASSEQTEVFLAVWERHYRAPRQVLISVDSEIAKPVQVHVTNLAGSLLGSYNLRVDATISELEIKMREVDPVVSEISFLNGGGEDVQKQDLLKDYASLHATSMDYDVDLIVEDTKPVLYPLSVDRTSQGAVVTDVRTAQLDACYDERSRGASYAQRLPLFVVELKPVQYVRQREQRQAVWDRQERQEMTDGQRFRRTWLSSDQLRWKRFLRKNWRKFAVKAERGWNKCVHSV